VDRPRHAAVPRVSVQAHQSGHSSRRWQRVLQHALGGRGAVPPQPVALPQAGLRRRGGVDEGAGPGRTAVPHGDGVDNRVRIGVPTIRRQPGLCVVDGVRRGPAAPLFFETRCADAHRVLRQSDVDRQGQEFRRRLRHGAGVRRRAAGVRIDRDWPAPLCRSTGLVPRRRSNERPCEVVGRRGGLPSGPAYSPRAADSSRRRLCVGAG
jgi:hypothetical protein